MHSRKSLHSLINYSFACVLSCLLLTSAHAEGPTGGSLSVVIRPEAVASVQASVIGVAHIEQTQSKNPGWMLQFDLPISVKIRLEKGIAADLVVEMSNDAAQQLPGYESSDVQIGGSTGAFPAKVSVNNSGVHSLNAVITLRGAGALPQGMLPIRLTLRSQDGAIEWAQAVQLVWTAAAA